MSTSLDGIPGGIWGMSPHDFASLPPPVSAGRLARAGWARVAPVLHFTLWDVRHEMSEGHDLRERQALVAKRNRPASFGDC